MINFSNYVNRSCSIVPNQDIKLYSKSLDFDYYPINDRESVILGGLLNVPEDKRGYISSKPLTNVECIDLKNGYYIVLPSVPKHIPNQKDLRPIENLILTFDNSSDFYNALNLLSELTISANISDKRIEFNSYSDYYKYKNYVKPEEESFVIQQKIQMEDFDI